MAFSVISVRPLRASTRTASSSISLRRSASRSSGSVGAATMRPSHLGQHLAGDDHDVVVAQPRRRRGDRRGEIVAGAELGQARSRAGSRSAAAAPCSVDRLSRARQIASPARHHFGRRRRVGHQQRDDAHVDAGDLRRCHPRRSASRRGCRRRNARRSERRRPPRWSRHPDHREAFVGHAAQRLSRDDGGVADHRRRRRPQRAADARDRRGWHRCSRPDWTARAARRRRSRWPRATPGPAVALSAPTNAKLCVGIWAR